MLSLHPLSVAVGFVAAAALAALAIALCRVAGLWPFGPDRYHGKLRDGMGGLPYDRPAPPAPRVDFDRARAVVEPGEFPVFRRGVLVGFVRRGAMPPDKDSIRLPVEGDPGAVPVLFYRGRVGWNTESCDAVLSRLHRSGFRKLAPILLALFAVPLAVHAIEVSNDGYTFHPAELSQFGHGPHRAGEILCVIGYAEMVHVEADGDTHTWVCETPAKRHMPERRDGCVLGEIVPSRPLPRLRRGSRVRMCGAWVEEDLAHKWTELHPVTSLEAIP